METLNIVVIEGQCPDSSDYGAEPHTAVEKAKRITAERSWTIRFGYEGEHALRYDGNPVVWSNSGRYQPVPAERSQSQGELLQIAAPPHRQSY